VSVVSQDLLLSCTLLMTGADTAPTGEEKGGGGRRSREQSDLAVSLLRRIICFPTTAGHKSQKPQNVRM